MSQAVRGVLFKQSVLCALLSLCACFLSISLGVSLFYGSVIVIVPNLIFVVVFFHRWRQRTRLAILISLYLGELIKLIFSGVLAIFSVKLFSQHIPVGGLLLGMALAYIAFWAFAAGALFKIKRVGAVG